jgi:hypothetical protein
MLPQLNAGLVAIGELDAGRFEGFPYRGELIRCRRASRVGSFRLSPACSR